MDVNISRLYFENKDEYNKFRNYVINIEVDSQVKDKIIGIETFDGITVKKAITEFIFDIEYALYVGNTNIKIEEITEVLQTEPEQFKKFNCYRKPNACEVWLNRKTGTLEGFYPLISDIRKAVVKENEEKYFKKYIKNLENIVVEKTANNLFHEIAYLIHKEGMEWGREKRNHFGITLCKEYSKVLKSTLEYEKDAREYVDQWNDFFIKAMEASVEEDEWLDAIIEMKILSFDELVAEKMDIKNISMEDAIWEINQRGPKGYLR